MNKAIQTNAGGTQPVDARSRDHAHTITVDLRQPPSEMRLGRLLGCVLIASTGVGCTLMPGTGGTGGTGRTGGVASSPPATEPPTLSAATVLSKLDSPWDVALSPAGMMFFTEKCKGLSVRQPSGTVTRLLGMKDTQGYAMTASDLFCQGQAGMTGLTLDPDFAKNRFIYVYSSSSMGSPPTNRVMRFTVSPDGNSLSGRKDIVTDIPYKVAKSDHPFGEPGAHNGGRLAFGPKDGFLYVTTGDNHNGELPQHPTRLGGKVLRIDRDGNAARGNNAPQGFDPRIYAYGFRNPQGITFRPGTGQPFIAEHGPWHSDEVTALVAGGNGGWDPRPNRGGRGDCPDRYCGYSPNQMGALDWKERSAFMPMTDLRQYPNALKPAWNNEGMSQGMTSGTFLSGRQWKQWDGKMMVSYLGIGIHGTPVGNRVDLLDISADGLSASRVKAALPLPPGRFRTVTQGPDGNLYVVAEEGEIHRIMPN